MISSENELAQQYNISRMTARTAITHLVGAGLLYRIAGKGTFVAAPKQVNRTASYVCIRDQLEQQGTHIETRIIISDERTVSRKAAQALNLPEDTKAFYIESVRITDDEPIYINRTYISPVTCPDYLKNEIGTKRTCDIMEKTYGIKTSHVKETLMSTVSSFEEANHLKVIPGYPLLFLTETEYDQENRPYAYSQLVFRGDKIMLSFDFVSDNNI